MTASTDSEPSLKIHRKPVSSTQNPISSPTSTMTTMTTATTRTSAESRSTPFEPEDASDLRRGTASTLMSPTEPVSPIIDNTLFEFPTPKTLQSFPAMPLYPPPVPPPPPATIASRPGTPSRIPDVTATQATPPTGRIPRDRSPSAERPPSRAKLQPKRQQPPHASQSPTPGGRSVSAQSPAAAVASVDAARAVSNPVDGRPQSKPSSEGSSPPNTAEKKKVRKSWFPGGGSKSNSHDAGKSTGSEAWVICPDSRVDYNTAFLVNGEKVPELWNEVGNVYVYLHPKESGRGPSFKVADQAFSSSSVLNELFVAEMMASADHGAEYLDVPGAAGPVTVGHLYLPLDNTHLEDLVAARNLFAFLTHQPLVGTPQNPTVFAAVLQIAGLLRRFNFCSYDGSSFGQSVDVAFDFLLDQFGLADVRDSREKTLEGLVLGEQMRSWNLYNEAFVHAVGKYESLLHLKSPLYDRISVKTRKRLERANFDLVNRQANVNTRLESFEFPSLFAGIASSTSTEEYRNVRFKEWRNSFAKMRSFVLSYYKGLFGDWPPRARSKKNHFSQSGLNRQCLKILYSDLCALYDLLVDRQSMTPRVMGEVYEDPSKEDAKENRIDPSISALRKILSEFEKSSPPVLPPIPYDIPKIPSMTAIYENYNELPAKKQAKYSKALQPHELQLILIKSRNIDTDALQMPFLLAFKEFELKEAKGVSPQDLADQRVGYWLFLYVVLQSLPMLVVDAPGLRFTEGVEYFLCEAPQGNPPWTEDAGEVRKMWYQTADQNLVELSADVVMFSVEGIYMRSHCWLAAKEWEQASSSSGPSAAAASAAVRPPPPPDFDLDLDSPNLQPPRPVFQDMDPCHGSPGQLRPASPGVRAVSAPNSPHLRPRSSSVNDRARQALRASIAIGLEPLPLPESPVQADFGHDSHHHRGSRLLSAGSIGSGETYHQLGLRASRSAVNLSQLDGGGGGAGSEAPRKSSYGGFGGPAGSGPGHAASESLGGGSTFDDILKGMDNGKKAKKRLFF
ncbi:hypothetical protein VTK56DRAFT_3345 [Thermocarpiscus australiensis]